jgi:hypothetical protein
MTMTSGKSSPVSRTRKMEMPSTPRYQCTPSALPVYWWSDTSWKPPSCTRMATKVAMAKPSVTSDTIRASA